MIIKVENISRNIFKIDNSYYIVVFKDACRSCDLYSKSQCIKYNPEPKDCLTMLGDNKYNRKCFKKLDELIKKGGI